MTMSSRSQRRTFGRHEAWIEEPDVFCMRFRGPVHAADLRAMEDFQLEWGAHKDMYYVLTDVVGVGEVSKDARSVLKEGRIHAYKNLRGVIYGANFTIRVIVDMITRAVRFLKQNASGPEADLLFVATEAEAREVIRQWRMRRLGRMEERAPIS